MAAGHSSAHHSLVAAGRQPGSASFAPSLALGEAEVCGRVLFLFPFLFFQLLTRAK